ncbi:MAG: hypothetical protein P1Q69_20635, partial [Candidatus Thorarchaeota archaeon]|nr:hypothetical protein [Candidatus Thorarchaeota archaeon]
SCGASANMFIVETESGEIGVLDAGFPHYTHGGVFGSVSRTGFIGIGDEKIGRFQSDSRLFSQNRNFHVFVDDVQVRGISNYLYTQDQLIGDQPPLKIIPLDYGGLIDLYHEGDTFNLYLRYRSLR